MTKLLRLRPKRPARLDWTYLFSLFVMVAAPYTGAFWYFIPVASSLLFQSEKKVHRLLPLLVAGFVFTAPLWTHRTFQAFDFLGLIFLFSFGAIHAALRLKRQNFLSHALVPGLIAALGAGVLVLVHFLQAKGSKAFDYATWAEVQLNSEVFPYFFQLDLYENTARETLTPLLTPIFVASLPSLFGLVMGIAFLINGLMENLLKSFRMANVRGQARVFDRFNRWKAPEWVLVPLVLGLLLVVMANWKNEIVWLPWVGWNLVFLSLLPVFIHGMAVVSFLFTRLSFLFFLLLLFGLLFLPLPLLIVCGLADLWLNIRGRIDKLGPQDQE